MKPPRHPSFLLVLTLDLLYLLFTLATWPLLLILFLSRRKWREGLIERMGFVPTLAPHPQRIWIHAISVGETEAAQPLVAALKKEFPRAELVFSTTTRTGRARAAKLFPDLPLFHSPLDFPWSVALAFSRVKPALVIQVESEWWPNFFFTAARRGIPVAVVNTRITERGLRGYRRFRWLIGRMMQSATFIAVQNEEYAARLQSLGVDADRLVVTGQMKYDSVTFAPPAGADDLARDLGLARGERLIVAGSTGSGEEEIILDAYARLRPKFADLRLAIVPRKPERFDEVATLIQSRNLPLIRRSQTRSAPAATTAKLTAGNPSAVILGDTMGELMKFYQLCVVAFIGRSLVPIGGSNPIDPASLSRPILFGPHMFNFPEAEELFVSARAARVVRNADSLAQTLAELLQSGPELQAMGDRAREAVLQRQGATARNIALLRQVLKA